MREKAEKPAKRKLTRAERKQIEAVIRQAKGDGKNHTVQDSIPFQNMFPDGLCRLEGGTFSKTIAFEDVNYRLAGSEDQRSIFESLCDFYNGYDPSIGVQVSLDSRSGGSAADELFGITRQGNDLDPIRDEAVDILRMQYKRGNNGYVKTKYVTLTRRTFPRRGPGLPALRPIPSTASRSWGQRLMCWTERNGWSCFTTSSTRRADSSPLNGTGSRPAAFR